MALTGTASELVLTDMQRELGIVGDKDEAVVSPESFDRPNLSFEIRKAGPGEKAAKLDEWLTLLPAELGIDSNELFGPDHAGIVFCRTVNPRRARRGGHQGSGVVDVAERLRGNPRLAGKRVEYYAGGKPRAFDERRDGKWTDYKDRVQRAFKANEFPLLVATHSFGMGIDKRNIRYTIHYAAPPSLEAFAQEAGRAGRNPKQKAVCAVVYTDDVLDDAHDFLLPTLTAEQAIARYEALPEDQRGDAAGAMFFHKGSYPSARQDAHRIRDLYITHLAPELLDVDACEIAIPYEGSEVAKKEIERSVYRLSLLGVVTDYTIDYGRDQILANVQWLDDDGVLDHLRSYVLRYRGSGKLKELEERFLEPMWTDRADGSVERAVEALCWFVYELVEKQRRAAIENMRRAFRSAADGAALKEELAKHLNNSVFSSRVKRLSETNPAEWWSVIDEVATPELAGKLSGACARTLESLPDHPGLLILRGLADAVVAEGDITTVARDLLAGMDIFRSSGVSTDTAQGIAARVFVSLTNLAPSALEAVAAALVAQGNELFARAAYSHVKDPDLKRACAAPYVTSILRQSRALAAAHLLG